MYKKVFSIVALCFSLVTFSQEEIIIFKNHLKTSSTGIKQVIPIVNKKNNDISIFIVDATKVYGYILNSNFKIINQLSSENRSRKYKTLIGNSISDTNDYRVYLANTKRNKFASINFSYETNTSSFHEFSLKSKDEKFIQTAVFENRFYLISVTKKTSILNIYSFDNEGNYSVNKIDFSQERFINRENKNASLYELLTISGGLYGTKSSTDVKKITENTPNSIEVASAYRKFYLRDQKIVFSFDQNKNFSQIILIDLVSFEKEVKRFKKPFNEIQSVSKKTNTYLNGDYIYAIASTPKKFIFTVQKFDSGEIVKEYSATVNDTIIFKNTPIIQKGGMYDDYRELEKTRKFLRKISSGDIGISIHLAYNKYQITLGGKIEQTTGGAGISFFGTQKGVLQGIAKGVQISKGTSRQIDVKMNHLGYVNPYFNPIFNNFYYYTQTKSTYIKCLFDTDFNHVTGEIKDNAFDKMKEFKEKDHYYPNGKTVFKYKDFYILGNYFSGSKAYRLRKFED